MKSPSGLGIWLWDMNQLCRSWPAIALRCAKMGMRWVCVRAGMFLACPPAVLAAFQAYGIDVFTWHYAVPSHIDAEVQTVRQCMASGSAGHVLDAEIEYETDKTASADAKRLVEAIRGLDGGSDFFLAYAPFCDPKVFPGYPYAEFAAECAAMPQFYWTAARKTAQSFCSWAETQWQPRGVSFTMPILSVWGSNDPRNIDPKAGSFAVSDLQWALDHWKDMPAISLWALESIHASAEAYLKSIAPSVTPVTPTADVSTLAGCQSALQSLGYYHGNLDGLNGPETKAAVIAFQKASALDPDGDIGTLTRTALASALASLHQ